MQLVFQDPYTSLDATQSVASAIDEVQRVFIFTGRRLKGAPPEPPNS